MNFRVSHFADIVVWNACETLLGFGVKLFIGDGCSSDKFFNSTKNSFYVTLLFYISSLHH